MEAVYFLLFALIFYIIYRALKRQNETTPSLATPTAENTPARIETSHNEKSYPWSEIRDDPNLPHVRSIHTKIRGVKQTNADGGCRQTVIRLWCQPGDALYFAREPRNQFDRNAIQVRRVVCSGDPSHPRLGEQLGYLSRELAEELAPTMDKQGFVLMGKIVNVTGGHDGESYGVNIQVEEYMPVSQVGCAVPAARHNKKPASRRKRKDESAGASARGT